MTRVLRLQPLLPYKLADAVIIILGALSPCVNPPEEERGPLWIA